MSIQNQKRNVKRKDRRANHTVDDGFIITIKEFTRGMAPDCVGITRRGRVNNSAYHIKKAILAWADSFPKKINGVPTGFTPAFRDVFKAIAWALFMDRGYAIFSYESLADAAHCDRQTAWRAVTYFRARGLVQVKTGKGWERKDRRNLANQYTVNLWAFINPETGEIVEPPYHTGKYEWELTAAVFRGRLENVTTVVKRDAGSKGVRGKTNPRNKMLLRSDQENGVTAPKRSNNLLPYKSNGMADANASPASADATAGSANAPLSIESVVDKVMPWTPEYGSPQVRYVKAGALAANLKVKVKEIIGGKSGRQIYDLCEKENFTSGIRDKSIFDQQRPEIFCPYGHIIVNDETGTVSYVEGTYFRIDLNDLNDGDVLVIEYYPSREIMEAAEARLKALRTGYG